MPRAPAILQSEYPYNISARCINREWFSIAMPLVWDIFSDELMRTSKEKNLLIHSFVLMSNHFHLIATTPDANISQCMQQFLQRTSRRLTREGNRINQTFAGRHFKCILDKQNYFLNAYKYNYLNPVMAGASKLVEDYPFSTLHALSKNRTLKFPLAEDSTFQADSKGTLEWLNCKPDERKLEAVRYGLKRQFFKSKIERRTRAPLISDYELL